MSYIRMNNLLRYFEGFSEAYVFPSCGESGKEDYIEDYDDKYEDNATFADLLVRFVYLETKDKDYAWKIAGILENKLPGIKRRPKPLTDKQFTDLMFKRKKNYKLKKK